VPDVLTTCALGATPYREGLALQDALVRARAAGETGDWLLYPDHPPVLTIGRNPSAENVLADAGTLAALGVEVFEVPRGGDVTWHGPGQLVGYPIVGLDRVNRDLHRWLRTLEEALIRALARHAIVSEMSPGRTGVWVGERKIASLGVAVRRWVGYHGFALNVRTDLSGFSLIHPCGLKGVRMTSMAAELGESAPTLEAMRETVTHELTQLLGYERAVAAPPAEARQWMEREVPAAENPRGTAPADEPRTGGIPTW
jgi:lipoate-protein ligase B